MAIRFNIRRIHGKVATRRFDRPRATVNGSFLATSWKAGWLHVLLFLPALVGTNSAPVAGGDGWNVPVPVVELDDEPVTRRVAARVSDGHHATNLAASNLWRNYSPSSSPWDSIRRAPRPAPARLREPASGAIDSSQPAPKYSDAVSSIPPVLLDVDDESRLSKPHRRIPSASTPNGSDALDDPGTPRYRAQAIESFAPPPKKTRVVSKVDDVAKNALHVVPIRETRVTPLFRSGPFQPGADGRLKRLDDTSKIRSSRKSIWRDDATTVTETVGYEVTDPARDAISLKVESIQDLPGRARTVPATFASLARQPPLPPEAVPAPAEKVETPARDGLADASVPDESFKSIQQVAINIAPSQGELPENFAKSRFARETTTPHVTGYSRYDVEVEVTWEAPALCHRPLVFEEVNLERHGYAVPWAQPALSAAHFFSRVPAAPYLMVAEKHRVCQYTLGHYRPGSPAPYVWYYPRFSLDASAVEAGLITGLIYAIP